MQMSWMLMKKTENWKDCLVHLCFDELKPVVILLLCDTLYDGLLISCAVSKCHSAYLNDHLLHLC